MTKETAGNPLCQTCGSILSLLDFHYRVNPQTNSMYRVCDACNTWVGPPIVLKDTPLGKNLL